MNQNTPELEQQIKSPRAKSSDRKARTSEPSLRIYLRGDAVKQAKTLADKATKSTGFKISESTIIDHSLDFIRGAAWVETLTDALNRRT